MLCVAGVGDPLATVASCEAICLPRVAHRGMVMMVKEGNTCILSRKCILVIFILKIASANFTHLLWFFRKEQKKKCSFNYVGSVSMFVELCCLKNQSRN